MGVDRLHNWIGRTETLSDVVTLGPLIGLAATLDHVDPPWVQGELPPLGHWLYFLPSAPQSQLGNDGHPLRGGFLPPVDLPRRMWAGGDFQFFKPIPIGAELTRTSAIIDVSPKSGRSGQMLFVNVEHTIFEGETPALRELHTIVYREAAKPSHPSLPPQTSSRDLEFGRKVIPDPVLLFRYSALTFNGHRIHYDRSYCEHEEGYPGLVVHGPLTATLLMDLYLRQRPGAAVKRFSFRALRPLFDIHPFQVCGVFTALGADLWALTHQGAIAMTAELSCH